MEKLSFCFPDNELISKLDERYDILEISYNKKTIKLKFNDQDYKDYEVEFSLKCKDELRDLSYFSRDEQGLFFEESSRPTTYAVEDKGSFRDISVYINTKCLYVSGSWSCVCDQYHSINIEFKKLEGF